MRVVLKHNLGLGVGRDYVLHERRHCPECPDERSMDGFH